MYKRGKHKNHHALKLSCIILSTKSKKDTLEPQSSTWLQLSSGTDVIVTKAIQNHTIQPRPFLTIDSKLRWNFLHSAVDVRILSYGYGTGCFKLHGIQLTKTSDAVLNIFSNDKMLEVLNPHLSLSSQKVKNLQLNSND